MKNIKIILSILLIILILLSMFILFNYKSNKIINYKFENNKLYITTNEKDWQEVPYDFSHTINYLKETNNGRFKEGTYQLTKQKIVFYAEESIGIIKDDLGNIIEDLGEQYSITLVYSDDNGNTWNTTKVATVTSRDSLIDINFKDAKNGNMRLKGRYGYENFDYVTYDGGKNWNNKN